MPIHSARKLRLTISAFALGLALLPFGAWADPVSVRAGARGEGARIIFEWPAAVEHRAFLKDNQLQLNFARPAEADLSTLPALLGPWVSAVQHSADGRQMTITLKRAVQMKSFASGSKVVVDLAPAATAPASPPAPRVSEIKLRVGTHKGYDRVVLGLGEEAKVSREGDQLTLTAPATQQLTPAQLNKLTVAAVENVVQDFAGQRLKLVFTLKPGADVKSFDLPGGVGFDFLNTEPTVPAPAAPAAPKAPPAPPAPEKPAAPVAKVQEAPPPAPKAAEAAPSAPVATVKPAEPQPVAAPAVKAVDAQPLAPTEVLPALQMSVPPQTPIAVMKRGSSLFVVVSEKDTPRELLPLVGEALSHSNRVTLLPAQGGRVVRVDLKDLVTAPKIESTATGWQVSFPASLDPVSVTPLDVEEQPDYSVGARVLVKAEQPALPVIFADPLVGDTLYAVPLAQPHVGVASRYHFVQCDLLPTVQGVLIKPWDDRLSVMSSTAGVEITTKGGLLLAEKLMGDKLLEARTASPAGDKARALGLPPLFDFAELGAPAGPEFLAKRQALQNEIIAAPPADRDTPRLHLARFYFANGMAAEANALWVRAVKSHPDLATEPDFPLIHAIAELSTGSLDSAEAALTQITQPSSDAALWRGYLAMQKRDWKGAGEQFGMAADRIWDYPEPYRTRLALAAAESALNVKDNDQAEMLLNKLGALYKAEGKERLPALEYLTGLLAWNRDEIPAAKARLGSAAQSWNQYWRVRAELALVEADLKQKKITPAEALSRVERLRFAWRGDALEFDIVYRLAQLHLQAGNFAAAFDDYARIEEKFPKDPRTAGLADEQKVAFTRIFQGEDRDQTPAFSQLAIWERYPDFRPTQPDVLEKINLYLADRVSGIDLLGRAAAFYGEVIKGTTDPQHRAELGAKMAGLYLLDRNYTDADKAISSTTTAVADGQPDPVSEVLRDERRMLQARALFGQNKQNEALALLANDYSEPAMRLRADITWQGKRWAEAAASLEALIGAPKLTDDAPLPAETASLVLRRATALALAGDQAGLHDLRAKFSTAMAKTADASTFQMLTRPEAGGGLPDRVTLSGRVAEVDLFQKFLERYRASPTDEPAAVQTAEHATPEATASKHE